MSSENDRRRPLICPESTIESANSSSSRRNFLRRAAMGAAAIGIGSTAVARTALPESSARSDSTVYGCSCAACGVGVQGCATGTRGKGVYGYAYGDCGVGVVGCASGCGQTKGVYGYSTSKSGYGVYGFDGAGGTGVIGFGTPGVEGKSCFTIGVFGCSPSCVGVCGSGGKIGVRGQATSASGIAVVARGATGQIANLQQWETGCTVYAVINGAGSLGLGGVTKPTHVLCVSGKGHVSSGLGIGTSCINTTLAVHGSISAKARSVSTGTSMTTADYAILANATSAAFAVTLPPAGTPGACNGMMVFIKKTDSTGNAVTVAPASGDNIEGSTSGIKLSRPFDSLELISNGAHEWFVLSGVKCGAVLS